MYEDVVRNINNALAALVQARIRLGLPAVSEEISQVALDQALSQDPNYLQARMAYRAAYDRVVALLPAGSKEAMALNETINWLALQAAEVGWSVGTGIVPDQSDGDDGGDGDRVVAFEHTADTDGGDNGPSDGGDA